jgi:hypothetical protein
MLRVALAARRIILHSTGPHVKEDGTIETIEEIVQKKRGDLADYKIIYWYNKDSRPDWLHPVITEPLYVLMFDGGQPPRGGGDSNLAEMFSESTIREAGTWRPLPRGMKVTGRMYRGAAALVMAEFEDCRGEKIDLAGFTTKGRNDRLAVWPTDRSAPQGGNRKKDLVAVGLVTPPYSVWLK